MRVTSPWTLLGYPLPADEWAIPPELLRLEADQDPRVGACCALFVSLLDGETTIGRRTQGFSRRTVYRLAAKWRRSQDVAAFRRSLKSAGRSRMARAPIEEVKRYLNSFKKGYQPSAFRTWLEQTHGIRVSVTTAKRFAREAVPAVKTEWEWRRWRSRKSVNHKPRIT